MTTEELNPARQRALCCERGTCQVPRRCLAQRPGSLTSAKLAAHDAVLTAAGIPIGKLISGEWVAVPVEPTHEMLHSATRWFGESEIGIYKSMLAARPKVTT